ncbi:hypothetical protein ACTXT7_014443 [Hymenolepis weldensis]
MSATQVHKVYLWITVITRKMEWSIEATSEYYIDQMDGISQVTHVVRSVRRWQVYIQNISSLDVSHVSLSESRRDDRHPFRYLCANRQTHRGTTCGHRSGDLIAS